MQLIHRRPGVGGVRRLVRPAVRQRPAVQARRPLPRAQHPLQARPGGWVTAPRTLARPRLARPDHAQLPRRGRAFAVRAARAARSPAVAAGPDRRQGRGTAVAAGSGGRGRRVPGRDLRVHNDATGRPFVAGHTRADPAPVGRLARAPRRDRRGDRTAAPGRSPRAGPGTGPGSTSRRSSNGTPRPWPPPSARTNSPCSGPDPPPPASRRRSGSPGSGRPRKRSRRRRAPDSAAGRGTSRSGGSGRR